MRREIKVGLTVIAAIALMYLTLAWVGRSSLFAPEQTEHQLVFEQVNGLLEGDPVVVRGYPSGRVLDIQPGANDVAVRIALDQSIELYGDAWAEIQIKELMGGKQVALWPGRNGSPLASGQIIPGKTSLDFSTAFSQFGQLFSQFSPEQLDRWKSSLDSLGHAFATTFDPNMFVGMLQNLDALTARLNRQTAALPVNQWVIQVDTALRVATTTLQLAQQTLAEVNQLSQRVENQTLPQGELILQDAQQALGEVNQLTQRVDRLLSNVDNPETLIGKALQDSVFAMQIEQTLQELEQTLKQINNKKIIVGFRRK